MTNLERRREELLQDLGEDGLGRSKDLDKSLQRDVLLRQVRQQANRRRNEVGLQLRIVALALETREEVERWARNELLRR
jgi:hypothetical protein